MRWYYYLHTNGDIIGKNPIVVDSDPEYFTSDWVKKVFTIETEDRHTFIEMLSACKKLGASERRVRELEEKNNVTEKDYECLNRINAGEDYKKVVADIFGE